MEKLASLKVDPKRFSDVRGSEFIVGDRPLRILLYERKSIKEQKLNSVLYGNNFWDLIYLTKDKITIVNKSTIPFANFLQEKIRGQVTTTQVMNWEDVPFITLLMMIVRTIPHPMAVNLIGQFIKLVATAYRKNI